MLVISDCAQVLNYVSYLSAYKNVHMYIYGESTEEVLLKYSPRTHAQNDRPGCLSCNS